MNNLQSFFKNIIFFISLSALFFLVSAFNQNYTTEYEGVKDLFFKTDSKKQIGIVDINKSKINFSVSHLLFSQVKGDFSNYKGTVSFEKEDLMDAKFSFSLNVNSISTNSQSRDKHLVSDKFFDSKNFPTIEFESTSFKKCDKNYSLEGEMKIKNVKKPVSFIIDKIENIDGKNIRLHATSVINRLDYDLKWSAIKEAGGLSVGKKIKIETDLFFNI